jgi:hypothetical protein
LRSIEQQERKTLVSEVQESKKGVWASGGHAPAPALLYWLRLDVPRIAAAAPGTAVNCHGVEACGTSFRGQRPSVLKSAQRSTKGLYADSIQNCD